MEINGPRTRSQPQVVATGNCKVKVTFRAIEGGPHKIRVFFNGIPVSSSPFSANFTYGNISANWEQLGLIPARKAVTFIVDPHGAAKAEVVVRILGK